MVDWFHQLDPRSSIALGAGVISLSSLILTVFVFKKRSEENVEAAQLARQQFTTTIRAQVSTATINSSEAGQKVTAYLAELGKTKSKLTAAESRHHEQLIDGHESAVAALLNAYNDGCAAYIEQNVDEVHFRKTFFAEICQLCNTKDGPINNLLHPKVTSNYQSLWLVYEKWQP